MSSNAPTADAATPSAANAASSDRPGAVIVVVVFFSRAFVPRRRFDEHRSDRVRDVPGREHPRVRQRLDRGGDGERRRATARRRRRRDSLRDESPVVALPQQRGHVRARDAGGVFFFFL